MPKVTVGLTAVKIAEGFSAPSIRNLGPGNVGLDTLDTVTMDTASIYLQPNESFEFPKNVNSSGWNRMYAISDVADTDVRFAEVS